MKLSEALEIGNSQNKAGRGKYYSEADDSTCTVGAIYKGVTGQNPPELPYSYHVVKTIAEHTGVNLLLINLPHPVPQKEDEKLVPLLRILININDLYRWDRQKQIEWLKENNL